MQLFEFIKVLLPTFILWNSLFWAERLAVYRHSESFADSGNYLTLNFSRLDGRTGNGFSGLWTTDSRQLKVRGEKRTYRKNVHYVIELPEGRFVGTLRRTALSCEPVLQYTVEKNGVLIRSGNLRGAFCL